MAISTYRYCVCTDGNICKYSFMISKAFCLPGTIGPCRAVCNAEAKVPFLRWTMCAWPSSLANSPWRTAGSRRCNQKSRPLLIMFHVAQTRIITPGRRFRFGRSRTWRHGAQHVAKKSSFYIVIVADTSYTRGLSQHLCPKTGRLCGVCSTKQAEQLHMPHFLQDVGGGAYPRGSIFVIHRGLPP